MISRVGIADIAIYSAIGHPSITTIAMILSILGSFYIKPGINW